MMSWSREKKNGLLVCSQLSTGYNMDSNKIDERIREKRRNGRGKRQRRWKIPASNFGTQEIRQPRMA
jgi:hypothetical protein